MYPTLSDLLHDLFGFNIPLPIQTFGLFVTTAFLIASFLLKKELKRREVNGQLSPSTETATIRHLDRRKKLSQTDQQVRIVSPHERVDTILGIAAVGGLIGAKLFDSLENWESYMAQPENFIAFSGLTFYGGLIVATIAILLYAHSKKINRWHLADSAAPALMIGYGVGRIGCHLAGDGDWGIENPFPKPFQAMPDWLWSYTYPNNVSDQGIPMASCQQAHCHILPHGVFPTSLYEFFICALLFFVLWLVRKKIKIPGLLFGIYLLMNSAERFLIEMIRVNNKYELGFIQPTQAELIAIFLFITGMFLIYIRVKTG
jgi:phosphatidylglycerol:prolipoprotein diacylglycerol transferase